MSLVFKMIVSIQTKENVYQINAVKPIEIAIPLQFNGAQPNAYGVDQAISKPCQAGELIGDTRGGGSCNFEQYTFIPHCNGTHTESVGHITHERISIHDCLKDVFIPATLVTVKPETALETNDTYPVGLDENDKLITRRALENAFQNLKSEGLIIRTLPNDASKQTQTYLENIPPFFSTEAMRFIVEKQIKHLLVDLPSIDRIFDDGKLSNHRIFWNVAPGAFEINQASRVNCTVTEMIFVPETIADGFYLLNLQIPAFVADAAPSRPVLIEILE